MSLNINIHNDALKSVPKNLAGLYALKGKLNACWKLRM